MWRRYTGECLLTLIFIFKALGGRCLGTDLHKVWINIFANIKPSSASFLIRGKRENFLVYALHFGPIFFPIVLGLLFAIFGRSWFIALYIFVSNIAGVIYSLYCGMPIFGKWIPSLHVAHGKLHCRFVH